jgi:hypothetical protein
MVFSFFFAGLFRRFVARLPGRLLALARPLGWFSLPGRFLVLARLLGFFFLGFFEGFSPGFLEGFLL